MFFSDMSSIHRVLDQDDKNVHGIDAVGVIAIWLMKEGPCQPTTFRPLLGDRVVRLLNYYTCLISLLLVGQ